MQKSKIDSYLQIRFYIRWRGYLDHKELIYIIFCSCLKPGLSTNILFFTNLSRHQNFLDESGLRPFILGRNRWCIHFPNYSWCRQTTFFQHWCKGSQKMKLWLNILYFHSISKFPANHQQAVICIFINYLVYPKSYEVKLSALACTQQQPQ
jgi:hypothetical protein